MPVEIKPVASRRDLTRFVKLPMRLYRNEPNWIPPLIAERRAFLDRHKNPFFSHAEAEFFLALRDGEPVGRITAHIDHHFNEFQGNDWGLFGFFECENDPEAAAALLDAARAWLRDRGRDRMVGPMDFTTNDECGLMIEGHERKPMILEGWHHRYYPELLEAWGLRKAMDLYMWELRLDKVEDKGGFHPLIHATSEKVKGELGVTVRHMDRKNLEREIAAFLEVYNQAWAHNWAFVPLDETEARWYTKNLRPILDENWTWIAERDGEVLGAALTLPDINLCLEHMNGRLLPFGWAKFLWHRRKIDQCRVLALGVKPQYQDLGIAAALYVAHLEEADPEQKKIWWGEMGWILETNDAMNRAMEGMGGNIVRRYRIFERELDGGDDEVEDTVAAWETVEGLAE